MKTTVQNTPYPKRSSVLWITTCGFFMALTVVLSSFGVPVPGGKLYLCDVAITTAAMLLDPVGAMLVGGIGTFIGDALYYPEAMYVSLVVHGLQAFVISWIAHNTFKNKPIYGSIAGLVLGTIILVAGYTLGKIFVYSTVEYAIVGLPFDTMQGVIGATCGFILTYGCHLKQIFEKKMNRYR